jgi:hypothetical protein
MDRLLFATMKMEMRYESGSEMAYGIAPTDQPKNGKTAVRRGFREGSSIVKTAQQS